CDSCLHVFDHTLTLHSFPTRRSSDLVVSDVWGKDVMVFEYSVELIQNQKFSSEKLNALKELLEKKLFDYAKQKKIQIISFLVIRSEEHTSELQSRFDLVCRLLLEKKK